MNGVIKVSLEEKQREAIRRMKKLGVYPETINQFKAGYISRSEPPLGAFYWVEGEELKRIRKFESEYNALVYLVVRAYTSFGTLDSYLYVSDHKDEWADDNDRLEHLCPFTYTANQTDPNLDDMGTICIEKTIAAGFVRTV